MAGRFSEERDFLSLSGINPQIVHLIAQALY